MPITNDREASYYGNRFAALTDKYDVSTSYIAESLGLAPSTVSNWKIRGVPSHYISDVAELLGVATTALRDRPDAPAKSAPRQMKPKVTTRTRITKLSVMEMIMNSPLDTEALKHIHQTIKYVSSNR
jgi:hypothetical protein